MVMIRTGKVTGREVSTNRDGQKTVLNLQVEITSPEDIQTVELMQPAGEDTNPPDGSKVIILSAGSAWKIAVAVDDGIEPEMQPGEKKVYSVSEGAIQAFINFLVSGNIEINGNADFAVRYTKLETAFNTLKSEFDTLVQTFNTHTHVYNPGPGSGAPTAVPAALGQPSQADISPAKVDTVKLP